LAILELDLIRALKIICSAGPSLCWFAVHLVDLLHFHDPNYLNPEASNISSFQLKFIFQDEVCFKLIFSLVPFLVFENLNVGNLKINLFLSTFFLSW